MAIKILRDEVWPQNRRLRVEVVWHNTVGIHFWKAVGFQAYSLELEMVPEARDVAAGRADRM